MTKPMGVEEILNGVFLAGTQGGTRLRVGPLDFDNALTFEQAKLALKQLIMGCVPDKQVIMVDCLEGEEFSREGFNSAIDQLHSNLERVFE